MQGSSITSLTPLGGGVIFSADDGTTGPELWRSDGTEAGTRLVLDIQPRAYDQQTWTPPSATSRVTTRMIVLPPLNPWVTAGSQPADVAIFNGRAVFTAFDEAHGRQVWSSDGTPAGTVADQRRGTDAGLVEFGDPVRSRRSAALLQPRQPADQPVARLAHRGARAIHGWWPLANS